MAADSRSEPRLSERRLHRQQHPDDCLRACVATILDLDDETIEGLPRHAAPGPGAWVEALKPLGYALLDAPLFVALFTDVPWILCAPSLHMPGFHAVVMRGRTLVWDPGRKTPRYTQNMVNAEMTVEGHQRGSCARLLVPLDPRVA